MQVLGCIPDEGVGAVPFNATNGALCFHTSKNMGRSVFEKKYVFAKLGRHFRAGRPPTPPGPEFISKAEATFLIIPSRGGDTTKERTP